MPRRRNTGPRVDPKYMYEDRFECEEAGSHQVTAVVWPPPRTAMSVVDPSLTLTCDLCGTNLIVYAGHATGQISGVSVVLPPHEANPPTRMLKETART